MRRRARAAVAAAVALALSGCAAPPTAGQELHVFAAASLTEVFTEIADAFEEAHPGVSVSLSFDGSAGLATQIAEGAPAAVFASADTATMESVAQHAADEPAVFARNALEIAVPAGNPADIRGFADLARDDVVVVVCAVVVPCGRATAEVERALDVAVDPASEENAVTDVLGKVTSGEADAGVVYATDVRRAGDAVEGVPVDAPDAAVNDYPIAALDGAPDPALARAFVDFVLDDPAQRVLADAGFLPAD
ncbi:molybdate ABC transporter substrate-binding protein [Microbacterium sp. JZ70]